MWVARHTPSERAPHEPGARGDGDASRSHSATNHVRHLAPRAGVPVWLEPKPDHLLSVVTRGHAPAARRQRTWRRAAPSVSTVSRRTPGVQSSGAHQLGPRADAGGASAFVYGVTVAPSGTTPCSTYRHSAMINLRASATIPIRRARLPAVAKRRTNHCVNALAGCQRTQPHAI